MLRRFYLIVPGIHQRPEGNDDWSDRACDWLHKNTTDVARDYEYACRWWQKSLTQKSRVDACASLLNSYADHERVMVAHSNGCAIALDVLKRYPHLQVDTLHLIGAAAPAHFDDNGLNAAFERGQINFVFLYGSRNDRALWLGGWSRRLLGWAGLGYGGLGRAKPAGMSRKASALTMRLWRDEYGHSSWFDTDRLAPRFPNVPPVTRFEDTMRLVTR